MNADNHIFKCHSQNLSLIATIHMTRLTEFRSVHCNIYIINQYRLLYLPYVPYKILAYKLQFIEIVRYQRIAPEFCMFAFPTASTTVSLNFVNAFL